jgi:hypothetical protein
MIIAISGSVHINLAMNLSIITFFFFFCPYWGLSVNKTQEGESGQKRMALTLGQKGAASAHASREPEVWGRKF